MKVVRRVSNSIELGEYEIPDFDFFSLGVQVKDFRTWTADAIWSTGRRACRPEVIVFTEACNSSGGEADFIVPYIGCFIIVELNRYVQTLRV